ncbi:hypothetical protein BDV59DRAFT_22823 [Aspergillus ambiguus]|uniref:uncharacterized protein n=1 Tax=Aspergillus ambiguus TaxID=176160 RepID=UPI003CCD7921
MSDPPADRVLGDSWVIPRKQPNNPADSMTTASSISGPELIMPSIYEAPLEASWVSPTLKKRRRASQPSQETPPRPSSQPAPPTSPLRQRPSLEQPVRILLNILLLAAIAHLLVLPELLHQHQSLCAISPLATLYPASCTPPFHRTPPHPPPNTVPSAQSQLASLLTSALTEMHPLAPALKHSESRLRDVQTALRARASPTPHHELDLEFAGCWDAARAATHKFDSLRADMRSAVDNLVVTADADADPPDPVRHATQLRRRAQYLEQLTARMQAKADALAADLARLEDHLDSIAGVLERDGGGEMPPTRDGDGDGDRGWDWVGALLPRGLARPTAVRAPIVRVFQHAAEQHRPVADAVRSLSSRLEGLQRRRGM